MTSIQEWVLRDMKFKFSFYKGYYGPIEILPRLYINRTKGRQWETDKKDFGDGWIAYKKKDGTEKVYDTMSIGFSWLLGFDIRISYELS